MFLSTRSKFFLAFALCACVFQGCSQPPANDNKPLTLDEPDKGRFPFSTKEPEVYQGDFVVNCGKIDQFYRVARKAAERKVDFFNRNAPTVTHIVSDRTYLVDHRKKAFAVVSGPEAKLVDVGGPYDYFRNVERRKFDLVRNEGDVAVYGDDETDTGKTILVYFDKSVGMIVKEEFRDRSDGGSGSETLCSFEIRNLKTNVDDGIFAVPAGYTSLSLRELAPEKYPNTELK